LAENAIPVSGCIQAALDVFNISLQSLTYGRNNSIRVKLQSMAWAKLKKTPSVLIVDVGGVSRTDMTVHEGVAFRK
jgi:hypothetical protein